MKLKDLRRLDQVRELRFPSYECMSRDQICDAKVCRSPLGPTGIHERLDL